LHATHNAQGDAQHTTPKAQVKHTVHPLLAGTERQCQFSFQD
jgi:hypothetical protein